jgi:hypothetical protein
MTEPMKETIPGFLVRNVARETVMGIEEALLVGAQRAFAAARGMDVGHLPHVVGQLRHFHMNEAFQRTLAAGELSPSPIRGNGVVTGRSGLVTLARFNVPERIWTNGRRSYTRRQMSQANAALEPLVQPGLFENYMPPSDAVAFFVACFSRPLLARPESPVSIQIAVPDRNMRDWLFRESVSAFVARYEQVQEVQQDWAIPTLKAGLGIKQENGGEVQ